MEVVFSDVTFTNDRQKADVNVVKKDNDTENPLSGGIFALYAGSDIANADGTVVVKKGTLIEKRQLEQMEKQHLPQICRLDFLM